MSRRGPKIRLPKREKVEVPSEGSDWQQERDAEADRIELFAKAKISLGEWCRSESINDDACFVLAQLVQYKASESAKLRAEAQLRQQAKKKKAPRTRKSKTKQLPSTSVAPEWRILTPGETIREGDEQTHRFQSQEIFYPVSKRNIGEKLVTCDLIFRRKVESDNPFDASSVPDGWREFTQREKNGQWVDGARYYAANKSGWRFNPSEFARGRLGANACPAERIIVPIT